MNRKGTATDSIIIIVIIFILGIVLLVVGAVFSPLKDSLDDTLGTAGNASLAQAENALRTRDMFFMIVWFGMAFVSLISAYLVRTQPAYIGIALLFYIPMLLLGPLFTNMYETLTNSTALSAESSTNMAKTDWFLDHLYIFNFGFSMLLLIVLYVSFRSGE